MVWQPKGKEEEEEENVMSALAGSKLKPGLLIKCNLSRHESTLDNLLK